MPQSILYENTRLAVARILGDGRRQRTRAFTEIQSHYLFEDRFGRPGKGNFKGKVEGTSGLRTAQFPGAHTYAGSHLPNMAANQFCRTPLSILEDIDVCLLAVNDVLVIQRELARCEYIGRRENVIAVGNSGTGKTHVALGPLATGPRAGGLRALPPASAGMSVGFTTTAGLVHELMESKDERRLLNLQRQLAWLNLLIIDELGFVPLSRTGAELFFEVFSQRYERGSIMPGPDPDRGLTTNLPFDEWTEVFGSEQLAPDPDRGSQQRTAGPPHPPQLAPDPDRGSTSWK